jgi:hypothetical protein
MSEAAGPAPVSTASPTPRKRGGVRLIGWLTLAAGVILVVAGVVTWFVVRNELSNEQITVSSDSAHFAGQPVNGPFTAYAQAETINKHALAASGGKTYAQLSQDDPTRQTVMTASFLRASLYTSVVSFGVAAMAVGLGVVFVLIGIALIRLASVYVLVPAVAMSGAMGGGAPPARSEPMTSEPMTSEPVRRHAGQAVDEGEVPSDAPAAETPSTESPSQPAAEAPSGTTAEEPPVRPEEPSS